ncbi:MAG: DUF4372 domain-containing protein [Balneolaceae bacterium]|nr:DUF4372 domain-containing protein [Balneolaceae bacterium]
MSPTKIAKKSDKPLLGQILDLIPSSLLNELIGHYESDKHCHKYKTYDQLVAMMFGQLNKCHTLRGDRPRHQCQAEISQRHWLGAEPGQVHNRATATPNATGRSLSRCI